MATNDVIGTTVVASSAGTFDASAAAAGYAATGQDRQQ
jgi:hypothetical protein